MDKCVFQWLEVELNITLCSAALFDVELMIEAYIKQTHLSLLSPLESFVA